MTNLSTDKWQQAYRFLGVYIDCTNSYGGGDGHSHDDNQNNNNGGEEQGCARWAMWAAVSEEKRLSTHKKDVWSINSFISCFVVLFQYSRRRVSHNSLIIMFQIP
jgi:hypothetical protein